MSSKQGENGTEDRTSTIPFAGGSLSRRAFGRYVAGAAAVAAITPRFASAQSSPATPEGTAAHPRGGSIAVPNVGDAVTLDPALDWGPSYFAWNNIYDSLVGFNKELKYEGVLAESWDVSPDGLAYTFRLRPGVTFHDGTEMNADAVKFTFDRILDPATKAVVLGWISPLKAAEVIDPLTVKLVLSEPFSPLLGSLCITSFGIVSPTAAKKYGADFGKNPVGTGAWKLKDWVSGETITLARNEAYHNFHTYMDNKGAPYLDELVFRIIPDAATQLSAFETNEVQVVNLAPRDVDRFKADPNYQVYVPTRNTGISMVEFATNKPAGGVGVEFKPPLDDLRLRQAIGYAINADEIIAKVLFGLAARNYGPMPNGLFAYNPAIEQYGFHFDPAKAKALLDEAGWVAGSDGMRAKGGQKLELLMWTWAGGANDKVLQVIQNQLQQVGLSVKIQVLEAATFIDGLKSGPANLWITGWNWPEPNILKLMTETAYGLGNYRDQQYLSLLDQASRESDFDKRSALYFEASKKLLADAAVIPLWTDWGATAVHANVKGYVLSPPRGVAAYEDIYIEE
jgi:peptide/nickel transport system substrate-binding protein